jgi:hypothetical protein
MDHSFLRKSDMLDFPTFAAIMNGIRGRTEVMASGSFVPLSLGFGILSNSIGKVNCEYSVTIDAQDAAQRLVKSLEFTVLMTDNEY